MRVRTCTNTIKKHGLTTTLSPSAWRPVSFRKETIKGHTSIMLATTSNRWRILKSLVRMAFFRVGREDVQSPVSAPFSRLMMNSVSASPSKLPNALEAVRCKHRSNRRRSNNGDSISFCRYPLPRYSQNAFTSTDEPPLLDDTDTSGPNASTVRPIAESF